VVAGEEGELRLVDSFVREIGTLVIIIEPPPGASLYDLAAAELAIEKVLGCKVDVVTREMVKRRKMQTAGKDPA
jgi:predicted nucleotidyltransferase